MGVASSQLVRTVNEDIGMIASGCEGDSSVHFRNIGAIFCIKKKLQIIFKKAVSYFGVKVPFWNCNLGHFYTWFLLYKIWTVYNGNNSKGLCISQHCTILHCRPKGFDADTKILLTTYILCPLKHECKQPRQWFCGVMSSLGGNCFPFLGTNITTCEGILVIWSGLCCFLGHSHSFGEPPKMRPNTSKIVFVWKAIFLRMFPKGSIPIFG
jgi:hypothetical protein